MNLVKHSVCCCHPNQPCQTNFISYEKKKPGKINKIFYIIKNKLLLEPHYLVFIYFLNYLQQSHHSNHI